MTDEEAYRLIGERATELSKREDVQNKMINNCKIALNL